MEEGQRGDGTSMLPQLDMMYPGARQVWQWLAQQGIATALVTASPRHDDNTLAMTTVGRQRQEEEFMSSRPPPPLRDMPPRDTFAAAADSSSLGPDSSLPAKVGRQVPPASSGVVVMVSPSAVVVNDTNNGGNQADTTTTAWLDTSKQQQQPTTLPNVVCLPHLWQLPRFLWQHMHIAGPLGNTNNDAPLKYDTPVPHTTACRLAAAGDLTGLQQQQCDDNDIMGRCATTGNTPLIWAADAGHLHVVEYLLERMMILLAASDNNNKDKMMASHHHHVNVRGYLGATAASRAACRGHADCLRALAMAGADLDIGNDKMQYPLHFAAFKEHMDCLQVLLEFGADTLVLDRKGRTPSMDTKNTEIRDILEQHTWRKHMHY